MAPEFKRKWKGQPCTNNLINELILNNKSGSHELFVKHAWFKTAYQQSKKMITEWFNGEGTMSWWNHQCVHLVLYQSSAELNCNNSYTTELLQELFSIMMREIKNCHKT